VQSQDRLRSTTSDLVLAREEIESRTVLRERIAELSVMAEDLTAALLELQSTGLPRLDDEFDFYDEVRRFEKSLIKRILRVTEGSQRKAAKLLRMKPTTLNSKLRSLKLGPWEGR